MAAPREIEPPPFVRLGPPEPVSPLVIAVPHAGRHYPAALDAARAVPRIKVEELEDRYADRLIGAALAGGAVAIVACHARAWIDLNRGEGDGPATPLSRRARAGLGLVPSRLGGRPLWHEPPSRDDIADRVARIHAPYHAAVAGALAAALARHGCALLLDCHSMPPLGQGERGARVVVGDLHGVSAGAAVSTAAVTAIRARGIAVARNAPYAGAYTLERHGRVHAHVHALQIEVDRSLYLAPGLREPSNRLDETALLIADIGWRAAEAAFPIDRARAAE